MTSARWVKHIQAIGGSRIAGFFLGVTLGAIVNLGPHTMLLVGTGGLVASVGWEIAGELRRARDRSRRARRVLAMRAPDQDAALFAEKHGHKEPVVGRAIEIWAHPSLESMLPLSELGVAPNRVEFCDPMPAEFGAALARCNGLRQFPPPNQRKFGIARLPTGTTDEEDLRVSFCETDWNTYRSVREVIQARPDIRAELSHIRPESSRIPQAMSLHLLVRFARGEVLALRRREGLATDGGQWSISVEEQLRESDFASGAGLTAEMLFRRAFVEEVYGRRECSRELLNRIWADDCLQYVRSYRVWSFFLEEHAGIFQTFGVVQLACEPGRLRQIHEAAASAGWGTTDPEGEMFVMPANDVETLLRTGRGEGRRLHGAPDLQPITDAALHPTSRYRLWRLHVALNRSESTLTALDLR